MNDYKEKRKILIRLAVIGFVVIFGAFYVFYPKLNVHIVSDFIWDDAQVCGDGVIVSKGEKYGLMDFKGNMIIPMQEKRLIETSCGLASYKGRNGLYGYRDSYGEVLIKPQYEKASDFSEDLAIVTDKKWRTKIINTKNEVVADISEPNYYVMSEILSTFKNGFALVQYSTIPQDYFPSLETDFSKYKYKAARVSKNGKKEYFNIDGFWRVNNNRNIIWDTDEKRVYNIDDGREITKVPQAQCFSFLNEYAVQWTELNNSPFIPYIIRLDSGEKTLMIDAFDFRGCKYIEELDVLAYASFGKLSYYDNYLRKCTINFEVDEMVHDEYDAINCENSNLIVVKKDGKYGMVRLD